MNQHFYISKENKQELGLFGDTICIISNAILTSKKLREPVHLYSENLPWDGWPKRWYEFLELAIDGEGVILESNCKIPSEAQRITSELKILENKESPYFKINWDIVNERAVPPKEIDYSNYICWSRRPRRMESLPKFIKNKYKKYKFINLADDRGRNVHGLQRKFNLYTTIWMMNACHRYIGIDSGGIHLAGCALPSSKISIIPDPSMYRYGRVPNWNGIFYDAMGYRVELPLLDQDYHYGFLQKAPLPDKVHHQW